MISKLRLKQLNAIAGFAVVIFIIVIIIIREVKRASLSEDHRYTIAVTTGRENTSKGVWVNFKYQVNGKEYEGGDTPYDLLNKIKQNKGRYFLKFLPSDRSIYEILWDYPVPEHIKEAPPNGWKEIPEE